MQFLVLTLTLSLHLLCMNVASAGPLVGIVMDWRERRGDALAGRAGRTMALAALSLFLLGMLLGGLMAWLAWTPEFWSDLLRRFPRRIFWSSWELVFSAVLLTVYWSWWRWAPGGRAARVGRSIVATLSGLNLLYHFPPLFVVAAMLSAGETAGAIEIGDATFPRLVWQGEVFALTVHFWLASFAVAGILLSILVSRPRGEDDAADPPPDAARLAAWGGKLALGASLLQIPVGVWLTSQLPALRQSRLLGGDLLGTTFFAAGVLGALWLLHRLTALAMGETRRSEVLRVAAILVLVVLLMTAALRRSRPEETAVTAWKTPRPASSETDHDPLASLSNWEPLRRSEILAMHSRSPIPCLTRIRTRFSILT